MQILRPIFILFVFIIAFTLNAQSQNENAKEFYRTAVLSMDCQTIKFIHKEQKRTKQANSLNECLTYEAIYASIPEDESSTLKFAKEIKGLETKFNSTKGLEAQIDDIILYIEKKLSNNKRHKQNEVDQLLNELANTKKDVLKDYQQNGGSIESQGGNKEAPIENVENKNIQNENNLVNSDNETGSEGISPVDGKIKSKNGNDWPTWLSLIVSLVAVFIAGFTLVKLTNLQELVKTFNKSNSGNLKVNPMSNDVMATNYVTKQELEQQILTLQAQLADLHNPKPFISHVENLGTVHHQTIPMIEDIPSPSQMASVEQNMMLTPDDYLENDEDDLGKSEIDDFKEESNPNPIQSDIQAAENEHQITYYYTKLGLNPTHFSSEDISDHVEMDSVFEIGVFSDNPNIAFFALVNSPINLNRCLAQPDKYLLPYCEYVGDTFGKVKISLLDEGALKWDTSNNSWQVITKSKIKIS